MKEIKLGTTEFIEAGGGNDDPYIIGSFGGEGTGKTRLPLTGPELIGFLPLERKSFATLDKDSRELGKRVIFPKDHDRLITNPRKANLISAPANNSEKAKEEANNKLRQYYRDYANRIYDAAYGLLEHPDVRMVVIDTFTQMCSIIDSALYGFEDKFIRVQGQLYKDRREYRQEIIDFLNSLATYRKHVFLLHRQKDEYGKSGPTGRKVWEGFAFLGHYTNLIIHHEANPKWNPEAKDEEKSWHFALSIRTCQKNPMVEGPDGYRFLKDEMITFAGLVLEVDPDADVDELM